MGLLKSELIKLTSTKSAYWLYGLGIVFGVAMAALIGQNIEAGGAGSEAPKAGGPPAMLATLGVGLFTVTLVWIAAIVAVTGEYRFNTMKTTFLAEPRRWKAILVKSAVLVVLGMVVTAVATVASLLVGGSIAGADSWDPTTGDGLRLAWRMPVYVGIGTLSALGLGYLMRNAAGAITLVLVWMVGVEQLVGQIPGVGEDIQKWMPFLNGAYWAEGGAGGTHAITWSETTALGWYSLVCVVLFVAGIVATLRRDA